MAQLVVDIALLRRYPVFRRLWFGQMVSGVGSQLTLVAVSYQAYRLTHSTLVVGLIGLVQLVPLLAGALWGGTLADAMDRRKVLILTQVAMAAAIGGLAVNASLLHPAVWPLFVCTAASAGFQGVDWPARRAALPMLVGPDDVTAAVALQTTIQTLALVAGPALAGVLIATIGLGAVYGIDVATFSVALVSALLLPALVPSGGGTPMGLRSMAEGFHHLRKEKLLSATYWSDLNAMIFGMPRAVFPALGVGLFGGGAGVVGLLYAAPGAGALLGSLVRVVQPGPPPGPRYRRLRGGLGRDHRPVRDHPRALDRPDPSGPRRRCRRRLRGVPPGGADADGARAPPGTAVGDLLRRGGRGPPPGRCRDRRGRRHRWTAVRRVVGGAGVCGRRCRPALAGSRALARQRGRCGAVGCGSAGGRRRGHQRTG